MLPLPIGVSPIRRPRAAAPRPARPNKKRPLKAKQADNLHDTISPPTHTQAGALQLPGPGGARDRGAERAGDGRAQAPRAGGPHLHRLGGRRRRLRGAWFGVDGCLCWAGLGRGRRPFPLPCGDPGRRLNPPTHIHPHAVYRQGNLPWSVSSERLRELFRDYNPLDVHVKTNMAGRSRGT